MTLYFIIIHFFIEILLHRMLPLEKITDNKGVILFTESMQNNFLIDSIRAWITIMLSINLLLLWVLYS